MAKFIEVNLTEIFEVPDDWEVVEDEDGNVALKTQDEQYLDFETTIYFADANNIDVDEVEWKPCLDDEMLDILDSKGLKQIKTELDIYELDEDELDFDEEDDEDF